jgi:long-subunit acyl-CoA synthetase (AMP-forming)
MELLTVATGGRIGFSTGSPLRVLEDMQILKPNFLPVVPRLMNKFYQAVVAAGSTPGLKGTLFNMAVKAKLERLHATGDPTHALWDRLIFNKVRRSGSLKTCLYEPMHEGSECFWWKPQICRLWLCASQSTSLGFHAYRFMLQDS